MWLVYRWRETTPPYRPILRSLDCETQPCLTVTANGLGAAASHQVWLEDGVIPRETRADRRRARGQGELGHPAKPAYKIPSIKAIHRRKRNGLKVVSTFSGCGGSSTGYEMSGFDVAAAVEFIPLAAESYRLNHPKTTLLERDIREVDGAAIIEATGLDVGEIDIFDGSPPCEPFSTAGVRDKGWGQVRPYSGKEQRSDDLFFEYARLVAELKPRVFIAENVTGLVKGKARGYFVAIHKALADLGYRVEARILDAQWLGVPQRRQRVIFVGVREDLGRDPVFPDPLPYRYTIREAFEAVGSEVAAGVGLFEDSYGNDAGWPKRHTSGEEPAPTINAAGTGRTLADRVSVVEGLINESRGHNFEDTDAELDMPAPTVCAGEGKSGNVGLKVVEGVSWDPGRKTARPRDVTDEPSPTVTTGGSEESHNVGANASHFRVRDRDVSDGEQTAASRRKLTIDELKSICGFPHDYRLAGPYSRQWERLGDSVPPPMMAAISATVRDEILAAP